MSEEQLAEAAQRQEEIFGETKTARAAYTRPASEQRNPKTFKEIKDANKETRKRRISGAMTKFGNRVAGGGAELARQLGVQALEGVQGLGKTAVKMGAGLTTATAAALASVPGGDINKLAQNTMIGYSAGSSFADSILRDKSIDMEAVEREAEMAAEGENYKNAVIERENKKIMQNPANINYLRQTMGISREEAREIMNSTGAECIDNGITDVKDIATIYKLTTGDDAMSFKQAVAAREYAQKRLPEDTDRMTEKSINQHKDRWASEFKDKYKNLSDTQAEALSNKAFDMAIRYNKAQSSLTKI